MNLAKSGQNQYNISKTITDGIARNHLPYLAHKREGLPIHSFIHSTPIQSKRITVDTPLFSMMWQVQQRQMNPRNGIC